MNAINQKLNVNQLSTVFSGIKDSFKPFTDLFQSTSFVEGNKTAISHLFEETLLNSKPWAAMSHKERFFFLGKNVVHAVSSRFDHAALACKSALDLIICTVRAVAASILRPVTSSVDPVKHWRHAGVALYTTFNGLVGVISPKLASTSQFLFSGAVLAVHGNNIHEKMNNLVDKIKEGFNAIFKKPAQVEVKA